MLEYFLGVSKQVISVVSEASVEYVNISSWIFLFISLFALITMGIFAFKAIKKWDSISEGYQDLIIVNVPLIIVFFIFVLAIALDNIIKVNTAPRAVQVQFVIDNIKSIKK
jgi:D-alanyl-lipoteichoic acid acyltransferase DltB (MBOAT superfamily)